MGVSIGWVNEKEHIFFSLPPFQAVIAMLDFVSIFTKGGILLWCYQGAGLLEEELRSFRAKVNAFVNDVLLQVRTV